MNLGSLFKISDEIDYISQSEEIFIKCLVFIFLGLIKNPEATLSPFGRPQRWRKTWAVPSDVKGGPFGNPLDRLFSPSF